MPVKKYFKKLIHFVSTYQYKNIGKKNNVFACNKRKKK